MRPATLAASRRPTASRPRTRLINWWRPVPAPHRWWQCPPPPGPPAAVPAERRFISSLVHARRVLAFFDPLNHPCPHWVAGATNEHRQTARPRHATNAGSRRAVGTLSTLRAARTQRQAPRPPHSHRLKQPSSQLTKARPLDLPVWPRRHKPESSSAIFRSKALRRLDSKTLPSFIASPIRAGVPNRSFTQPSA